MIIQWCIPKVQSFSPINSTHVYMHVSYVWDQDSLYKIISSDISWAKRITYYFQTEGKYSGEESPHTVLSWGSFYSLRLAIMPTTPADSSRWSTRRVALKWTPMQKTKSIQVRRSQCYLVAHFTL